MTDKIYGYKDNKSKVEVLPKSESVKDIRLSTTAERCSVDVINAAGGGGHKY